MTDQDRANVQAIVTMMTLAKATERPGLRKAIWLDVGLHLARLRAHHTGAEWESIVKEGCGLAKTRAYEIMALARKNFAEKSTAVAEKPQQNQASDKPR